MGVKNEEFDLDAPRTLVFTTSTQHLDRAEKTLPW